MKYYNFENEEDFNKILVCNNACWTIGEISNLLPEKIKPFLIDIIATLAEILNTDILTQLSKSNEQLLKHFAKTVAITLGRLGSINP